MDNHTGPIPDSMTSDLEALKLTLASMAPSDLRADQAKALAQEISAIRLHLKRLEADRTWEQHFAPPAA